MENRITHLGMIMDGNRRWAKRNMLKSVLEGHKSGAYKLLDVCGWCQDVNIPYLSVYAFSTENWERSNYEVDGLFQLMQNFFREELENCIEHGIRIKIMGNRSLLKEDALKTIERVEELTSRCEKLTVCIALSYGGRDEIIRAVKVCCEDIRLGRLKSEAIDEDVFRSYLDTDNIPDMDMVIRTGGNHRLSNFFPWQTAYAELYFLDTLWPDFSREMFDEALKYYESVTINKGK